MRDQPPARAEGPTLGEHLRRYRRRERLKNPDLARRLALSDGQITRLLNDRLPRLSLDTAERCAQLLGCSLDEIAAAHHRGRLTLMREEGATPVRAAAR